MHACGHDRHTAILLAAARVLAEQEGFDAVVSGGRDDLTKRIEADVALHSKRAEFAKMRE